MPFFDSDDARIFWRTDGRAGAPALVLANSLASDTSLWDALMPELMRRWRVLRVDLPGHGASTVHGDRAQWSIPELGSHVLEAADAAGMAEFSFVGVSIGGMIGLWLASNSDRMKRLVASNTSATMDPAIWKDRIDTARQKGLAPLVDGTMQRWFTEGFRAKDPVEVANIREHFLQVDPKGYIGCSIAIRDLDIHGGLGHISVPTLVLSGTHDAAMPPAAGQAIARDVKGARYLELPVAHIPHLEQPELFLRAVGAHLA